MKNGRRITILVEMNIWVTSYSFFFNLFVWFCLFSFIFCKRVIKRWRVNNWEFLIQRKIELTRQTMWHHIAVSTTVIFTLSLTSSWAQNFQDMHSTSLYYLQHKIISQYKKKLKAHIVICINVELPFYSLESEAASFKHDLIIFASFAQASKHSCIPCMREYKMSPRVTNLEQ